MNITIMFLADSVRRLLGLPAKTWPLACHECGTYLLPTQQNRDKCIDCEHPFCPECALFSKDPKAWTADERLELGPGEVPARMLKEPDAALVKNKKPGVYAGNQKQGW